MKLATIQRSEIIIGERFRETSWGDIDGLAHSMKTEGIISPLAVQEREDGTYYLLAGGRRIRAAEKAKIDLIPVRIYDEPLTEMKVREIELMENVMREDLSWLEAANLRNEIHELRQSQYGIKKSTSPDADGISLRDTAKLLNESVGGLSMSINLAKAAEQFPSLKEAKSASEANKMLASLRENIIKAEIAKRLRDKTANTPIERIHADLISRYIIDDFFNNIKKVPDGSIDLMEIDPPYGIDLRQTKKLQQRDVKLEMYEEVKEDDYILFMDKVIGEGKRVLKGNGWLILWFAIEPWIEQMYNLLIKNGFKTRRLVGMWYKGDGQLQSMQPDRYLASSYEPFFYATKGDGMIVRQGRSNVFTYKPVPSVRKIHPTERPIELIEDILQTFCTEGATINVPFLGSGNTVLAASNLGMSAFGTDLVSEYKDAYSIRVSQGRPQLYKSYKGDKE